MKHAKLAASTAARWMNCPGSVEALSHYDRTTSFYAMEGTAAHLLASTALRARRPPASFMGKPLAIVESDTLEDFIPRTEAQVKRALTQGYFIITVHEEMASAVDLYYKTVLADLPRGVELHVEEYLDLTSLNPLMGGTADAWYLDGETVHLFDYKHGQSVRVDIEDNPQVKIYSLGVLLKSPSATGVVTTIIQPRNHHGDAVRATSYSRRELEAFGRVVVKKAAAASVPDAKFKAGTWCRWCLHKVVCEEYNR